MVSPTHFREPCSVAPPSNGRGQQSLVLTGGEFGSELYRHRLSRTLSQAELAKLAAMSAGYLSELENSKRKPPTPRIVKRLSAALGLTAPEQQKLLRIATSERACAAAGALTPKLARLLQALHAAAPCLPEPTIDKLINTLEEARM